MRRHRIGLALERIARDNGGIHVNGAVKCARKNVVQFLRVVFPATQFQSNARAIALGDYCFVFSHVCPLFSLRLP